MYVLFTAVNATVKSTRLWNIYFTYKFVRIFMLKVILNLTDDIRGQALST